MRGDPSSAVQQLLIEGQTTLNAKLIETAYQLLQRYQSKVPEASTLSEAIETLRSSYSTRPNQAKKSNQTRQAGGLQFRASAMAA
jgi:bisphosphoglycerate-dependent phosphoglycerate mutase